MEKLKEVMDKSKMTVIDHSFESLASLNLNKFENEWILLIDGELVEHAKDERTILEIAKNKYGDAVPFLVKVPKKGTTVVVPA